MASNVINIKMLFEYLTRQVIGSEGSHSVNVKCFRRLHELSDVSFHCANSFFSAERHSHDALMQVQNCGPLPVVSILFWPDLNF